MKGNINRVSTENYKLDYLLGKYMNIYINQTCTENSIRNQYQ